MWERILLVGCGGFLGSSARFALATAVNHLAGGRWPWGTLAVNGLGCLAMGAVMGLVPPTSAPTPAVLFLATGVLGGFTTFSAFGHETMELLRHGAWVSATANVIGNVTLGLFAVAAGRAAVLGANGA